MSKIFNVDKAFDEYFNEVENYGLRSERFFEDVQYAFVKGDSKVIVEWMKASFEMGARAMAQDTLDTLRDYATAVAGCTIEEPMQPEHAFDSAADNLSVYYSDIKILGEHNE